MHNKHLFALYMLSLLALIGCAPNPVTPEATPTLSQPELAGGSTRLSPKDGVTLVYVPAGQFIMGTEATHPMAQADESPQHAVTLDAFWIDQTEITNERYMRCVEAGACKPLLTL